MRRESYLRLWREQEERTNVGVSEPWLLFMDIVLILGRQAILASVNEKTVTEVSQFVQDADPEKYSIHYAQL